MPVAFEFVFVVAIAGVEDSHRLVAVRRAEHLGGEHFVHFEAVAIVELGGLGEAADVIGIAPEEQARGAAAPELPVDFVLLRVAQEVGIAVAALLLVLNVDVRRVERQPFLLHPELCADARFQALT